MITFQQAEQLTLEYIKPSAEYIKKTLPDDEIVIEHSVEFPDCWLFFWNSKRYLETKNIFHRLLGGGPVIVGKENGDVYQGGSGGTVEMWLSEFRDYVREKILLRIKLKIWNKFTEVRFCWKQEDHYASGHPL